MASYDDVVERIAGLRGELCALDNTQGKVPALSKSIWEAMVFDWYLDDIEAAFVDEFGDYLRDKGWLDDNDAWANHDLLPFAFVGPGSSDGTQYPQQILGCILFFDLAVDGDEPAILVGYPDDFDLTPCCARIEELGLQPAGR